MDDEQFTDNKQLKIVVVGDGASGKTSIIQRFLSDKFGEEYNQTVGLDFFTKQLQLSTAVVATLHIYDIGGQTLGGNMLDKYINGANGFILVYDITSYSSFESLGDWLKYIRASTINMNESREKVPIILCANKSDLEHMRAVKTEKHQRLVTENHISSHFVSARTGEGITRMFATVAAESIGINLSKADFDQFSTVVHAPIIKSRNGVTQSQHNPSNEPSEKSSRFCVIN